MSILADVEKNIKEKSLIWLQDVMSRWACNVKVFKPVKNTYSKVYGTESGDNTTTDFILIQAAVVSDDFFPSDCYSAGFKEGILYTDTDKICVGDTVSLDRDDCRTRRYQVMSEQTVGTTQKVFRKFRLSALGD